MTLVGRGAVRFYSKANETRAFSKSYFTLSLTALGDVDAVSIPRNATRYGKRDYFEKALGYE